MDNERCAIGEGSAAHFQNERYHGPFFHHLGKDFDTCTHGPNLAVAARTEALLIANEFLENELATQVSYGYTRGMGHGKFNTYSG